MTTYPSRDEAHAAMLAKNRANAAAGNRRELVVLVDGPDEGEATVMPLRDAIEAEFLYEWAV